MIPHHRRTFLLMLMTAVVGSTLLFSLRLLDAAGGAGQNPAPVPALSGRPEGAASVDVSLETTLAMTSFVPMFAFNLHTPPPLMGVQIYGTPSDEAGLGKIVDAGLQWVRMPISWSGVEPENTSPANFNWSFVDEQIGALAEKGVEPLITITGNPSWAAAYPMGPVYDLVDIQQFMGALVERFDGDGIADAPGSPIVRYWEIYNEPDNTDPFLAELGFLGFFGYQGHKYGALLDAIYPIVKAASPKAQVVFGGVASDNFDYNGGVFDPDFTDWALDACKGPCFDVMNFHYYPLYRHRWERYGRDVIGKAQFFWDKMVHFGFERPMMCTETTWPMTSYWGSEAMQSRYVVASTVRGMAAGLLVQNWYAWRDMDASLPGLLDESYTPKKAYYVYQVLTEQLGRGRYRRPLVPVETGGGNIEGYVFDVPTSEGQKRVDVIWLDCPQYRQSPPQDCPAGAEQVMYVQASSVRVTGMLGSWSTVDDASDGVEDGLVRLTIKADPIYVEHDPAATSSGVAPAQGVENLVQAPLARNDAPNYPNCRFGVGAVGAVSDYELDALNLGWYVNWESELAPEEPSGLEYVHTVRLRQAGTAGWQVVSPTMEEFTATIQSNPGAIWFLGNEPDSPWQDDMMPEVYALAYHDVYYSIKQLDPTAQVGIGGIVQPTSLRFEYLDTVWDSYAQTFSETMPVDIWNIHTFILRETITAPDPEPCKPVTATIPVWGAYVPPGSSALSGELYCVRDQDDLSIFEQRILDFRAWMAENGQREKPLYITEYGVLFYEDLNDEDQRSFDQVRVGQYMTETFDLMLNLSDPTIGYPYDDGRLVQRWAWFSLDADPNYWGGTLFDPVTREVRDLGRTFADYTLEVGPSVDLFAAAARATPSVFGPDELPVTPTLRATVSNIGNVSTTLPVEVTFYDGLPGEEGTQPIGSVQTVLGGLEGCAGFAEVSVEWPGLGSGSHRFYVQVDAAGKVTETNEINNVTSGTVLVADDRLYLPLAVTGAE